MTQFFPGSRQALTPPTGPPDILAGMKGKFYRIRGVDTELFSISQLAEAVNRSTVTVRKWEENGVIPPATFSKPGAEGDKRGRRRLYSREQIEAIVRIAGEEKVLYDLNRWISRTKFQARVLQAFREIASRK